jgi:hypothetical protein
VAIRLLKSCAYPRNSAIVLKPGVAGFHFKRAIEIRQPHGWAAVSVLLQRVPGEFGFACQMGMFRGRLIVE